MFIRAFLYLLAALAFFLGLPLFGWGVDDPLGFLLNPPRFVYAAAVVLLALAVALQALTNPEGLPGLRSPRGKQVSPAQVSARQAMMALLYLSLAFLPYLDRRNFATYPSNESLAWIGTVLCILGYAMLYASGVLLGKMYSPEVDVLPGHKLVTSGIYQMIRHPRYLGHVLAVLGLALLFRSWIGLGAVLLLAPLVHFRMRAEERLLYQKFGKAYAAYAHDTPRLIPFVY